MKIPVCVIAFVAVASVAYAQPGDKLEIKHQRDLSNQAIAAHDTSAMANIWADDLVVTTSRSVTMNGKHANLLAFQSEFNTKKDLLYVRTQNIVEVFVRWKMASESGTWVGTWTLNGEKVKIGGSYYAKWHKINDIWKIRSEIYTPTYCEGEEYCKSFK